MSVAVGDEVEGVLLVLDTALPPEFRVEMDLAGFAGSFGSAAPAGVESQNFTHRQKIPGEWHAGGTGCANVVVARRPWPAGANMNLYVSPHDAAIAAERQCPHCRGTGRRLDFMVSGMRVIAPCSCPLGESETTICEIGNPHARNIHDPSQHRRPSNILGRPKTAAAYWSRVQPQEEVLKGLKY